MTMLDEQVEWNRCAGDPVYFINKYWKIPKYDYRMPDPKLYAFQEELVDVLKDERQVVINSSRQMGTTNVVAAHCLHQMLFKPDICVVHINVNIRQGIEVLNLIEHTHSLLPTYLSPGILSSDKRKLALNNGSHFTVVSGEQPGKSSGVHILYVDNAGFTKENVYQAAAATVAIGGQIIMASTMYRNNWFLELCQEVERLELGWKYIKLPYWVHPRRDRLWRSDQERILGINSATDECDCTHYFNKDGSISKIIED